MKWCHPEMPSPPAALKPSSGGPLPAHMGPTCLISFCMAHMGSTWWSRSKCPEPALVKWCHPEMPSPPAALKPSSGGPLPAHMGPTCLISFCMAHMGSTWCSRSKCPEPALVKRCHPEKPSPPAAPRLLSGGQQPVTWDLHVSANRCSNLMVGPRTGRTYPAAPISFSGAAVPLPMGATWPCNAIPKDCFGLRISSKRPSPPAAPRLSPACS
jgi:hypothetical protein